MNKALRLLWNFIKRSWKILSGILIIILAIYFLIHSKAEIQGIIKNISKADSLYIIIGLFIAGIYIILQGCIYYFSFRTVGSNTTLFKSINLFLKRFSVSVVLPAGGIAVLAMFPSVVENENNPKRKIYLGSILFGFIGVFSIFLFSLPGLGVMEVSQTLTKQEIWIVIVLLLFILALSLILISIFKRTWAFRMIAKKVPEFKLLNKEIAEGSFNKKEFLKAIGSSLMLDLTGVVHLYLAMKAIGFPATFEQVFIGHIISTVIMMISPFLKGTGAIEASLSFILIRYGVPINTAISVSLIYRFLQFWIPTIIGFLSFLIFPIKNK